MGLSTRITIRPKAGEGVKQGLHKAILKTAIDITTIAKGFAPVGDTGQLRASLEYGYIDYLTAYSGTNLYYAVYVEMGTGRQSAQPYMRPAKNVIKSGAKGLTQVKAIINNDLKKALAYQKTFNKDN